MMARRVARLVVRRAVPATLVAVAGRPTRASALSEERMGPLVCDHLGDKGSPHNTPTAAVKIANFFMTLPPFETHDILDGETFLDTGQQSALALKNYFAGIALRQIRCCEGHLPCGLKPPQSGGPKRRTAGERPLPLFSLPSPRWDVAGRRALADPPGLPLPYPRRPETNARSTDRVA